MNDFIQNFDIDFKFNLAHAASVDLNLCELVKRYGFVIEKGDDDLDQYEALTLSLGGKISFRLCRYVNLKGNLIHIFIESQRKDWREQLQKILAVLPEKTLVIWINDNYYATP